MIDPEQPATYFRPDPLTGWTIYIRPDPERPNRLRTFYVSRSGRAEWGVGPDEFVDLKRGVAAVTDWLVQVASRAIRDDRWENAPQMKQYEAIALERAHERERLELERRRQEEERRQTEQQEYLRFRDEVQAALKQFRSRRTITVSTSDGPKTVSAAVWDVFAIHQPVLGSKRDRASQWVLTHVPTGLAITSGELRSGLAWLATQLRLRPAPWESPNAKELERSGVGRTFGELHAQLRKHGLI